MMLFAGFIVLWGIKELFVPTKVVECTDEGLALNINGPFRPPTVIPWDLIDDVRGIEVEDEGDMVPMLSVRVLGRGELPDHPWGARWVGERELALLAQDWPDSPDRIATQIVDFALAAARRRTRKRTASVWKPEEES